MRARIRQGPLVQIDETSVQVMGEPGRPVVDCQHHPSHPGKIPSDVLRDYKGFIQTDGYDGCDELGGQPGRSPGTSAAPMRRWPESMRSSGSNGLCESQVPPSTTPGSAIGQTIGQWPKLICYLDSPLLGPDNNALRRALLPLHQFLAKLKLVDYRVRVFITTSDGKKTCDTVGADKNIIKAYWQALMDIMEYAYINHAKPHPHK
jgi:hypothetical protein